MKNLGIGIAVAAAAIALAWWLHERAPEQVSSPAPWPAAQASAGIDPGILRVPANPDPGMVRIVENPDPGMVREGEDDG